MTYASLRLSATFLVLATSTAFASGAGPVTHEQELHPAPLYNGNTPIDRSHGLLFNNGTFGLNNPTIEEWAKAKVLFPGISETSYPYENRKHFIREAQNQVEWGHAAIRNYQHVSADSLPEAADHSKKAISTLEPALQRLEKAVDAVEDAGKNDWDLAQSELRKALIDFRMAYTQMHKNASL